jgi:hypothetical protein
MFLCSNGNRRLKVKHTILAAQAALVLLGLLLPAGCIGISKTDLMATQEIIVRPTVAAEAWQTSEAEIETAITATLTAISARQKVALVSFHGQYITAKGRGSDWSLVQEPRLSDCGWFTLYQLDDGKVALATCYGSYITAPQNGALRADWLLWQEPELGECGQFILHDLGDAGVAFETCAGKFFTAGDGGWAPGLEWTIVAETDALRDWEHFTMLQQYVPPLFIIADYE